MCSCVHTCLYVHYMGAGVHRDQRCPIFLQLEIEAVVASCLTRVLGTELGASAAVVQALTAGTSH